MYLEASISGKDTLQQGGSSPGTSLSQRLSTQPRGGPNSSANPRTLRKSHASLPLGEIHPLRLNVAPDLALPVHLPSRDRSSILFSTLRQYVCDARFPAPSRRGHARPQLTPSQRRIPPFPFPSSLAVSPLFSVSHRQAGPRTIFDQPRRGTPPNPREEAPCQNLVPTQSHGRRTLGRASGLHIHTIRLCTHRRLCYPTPPDDLGHRPSIPPDDGTAPHLHRSRSADPFVSPSHTVVHDFRGLLAASQERGSGPRH